MVVFNRRGIGILEVTIALAILAIASMGIIQLFTSMNRAQKSVELSNDFVALQTSVLGVLNSERSCAAALGPYFLNPTGATAIPSLVVGSNTIAAVNTITQGLQTTSLQIENPVSLGTRTVGGVTQKQYSAVFRVVADKKDAQGKSSIGAQGYNKPFNIGIYTNPALTNPSGHERIVECFGQFSDAKACEDIGGIYQTYDDTRSARCLLTKLGISDDIISRTTHLDTSGYPLAVIQASPRTGASPGVAFFADFGTTLADKATYIWLRSLYDDPSLATHSHPQWGLQASPINDTFAIHQGSVGNHFTVAKDGNIGIGLNNVAPVGQLHIRSSNPNQNAHIYLEPLSGAQATQWRQVSIASDGRFEICNPAVCGFRIYKNAPEAALHLSASGVDSTFGHIIGPSDVRLKKDVTPLASSLDKVLALRSVTYRWKEDTKEAPAKPGFIAQEVEKVIPELVKTQNDQMKTKSIEQNYITPYLVKAIQEQQQLINQLKSDLEQEKRERALLSDRLKKIEK